MNNKTVLLCENCTGCGACTSICKKNAISLITDSMGFWHAHIDDTKCINCGLCTKLCGESLLGQKPLKVYAIRHKNKNEIKSSRSGAFFVSLAEYVLIKNGVVYGAAMNDDFKVNHIRINNINGITSLKKSKYTQSFISKQIYEQLIDDVKSNMFVLFTGTGCQVAKTKQLLIAKKIKLDNVFFMDIICHGVPTPKLWMDYINYIQSKNKSIIVSADFRDKSAGWSKHFESFTFKRFCTKVKTFSNLYTKLFYSNYFLRESCFKCQYANLYRCADFTIGDYWGWETVCPDFNKDNLGVSLVLINSLKALNAFKEFNNSLYAVDCSDKNYLQHNLVKPTPKPLYYKSMQDFYIKYGFEIFINKKGYNSCIKNIKRKIYSFYLNILSLL